MQAPAADINIRDNYLSFHHKSIYEYNILEKKLKRLNDAKEEVWKTLLPRKEDILEQFKFTISDNVDYIKLGEKLSKEFRIKDDSNRRELLILLVKYCSIITNINNTQKEFELADKKRNLNFSDYRYFVFKYYSKVHKFLLEGKAYRYNGGIGTLYIDRIQIKSEGKKIDFHKTKLRKEELLKQGVKLYNKQDAAKAELLGIPYDGVDYRVWLRAPAYYSLKFVHSKYFGRSYDFTPISYIHQKYRDYTQDQLALEVCENNEDIYDLQVDLRTKITIYLKRNPERYINFQRDINDKDE
ncbi:MAG: hypothetical protein J6M39_06465 [Lachnospiraceae bacterium]|nr:hypothetical protein [Lachnospiraceae bacterium]